MCLCLCSTVLLYVQRCLRLDQSGEFWTSKRPDHSPFTIAVQPYLALEQIGMTVLLVNVTVCVSVFVPQSFNVQLCPTLDQSGEFLTLFDPVP